MPVNRNADFYLNGNPYMLARGQYKGRAWRRTGAPDTPGRRLATDVKYGVLPDELDRPEVWDDWSGGYGDAYRDPASPNRYHWSENMDARFPRQLIHCQQPLFLGSARILNIDSAYSGTNLAATIGSRLFSFVDCPTPGNWVASGPMISGGRHAVALGGYNTYAALTPAAPNIERISNSGFETAGGGGADVFGRWTEQAGDGAIADEGTLVHGGSHAAKLTGGPTPNSTPNIYQPFAAIPGASHSVSFWTRGDGTNAGRWGIWDDTAYGWVTGFAKITTGIAGTTYTQVTATFTVPDNCLSISIFFYSPNINGGIAYFDDVSILASYDLLTNSVAIWPDTAGSKMHVGHQMAIGGSDPRLYLPDLRGSCFDSVVLSNGILESGVLTPSMGAIAFTVAGNRIWKAAGGQAVLANRLQSADLNSNPYSTLGDWSATLSIGAHDSPIKYLAVLNEQVFAGMQDGVYSGDQTGTFYRVVDVSGQQHEDNCRDLAIFQGRLITPAISGLFAYEPSAYQAQVTDISPPNLRRERSPVRGWLRAVRPHGQWLKAGLYTGSVSYLLAGRPDSASRDGFQWHVLNRLPGTMKISRIHVDGITAATTGAQMPNRFWAAADASIDTAGTSSVLYWPVPMNDENPMGPSLAFSAWYTGSGRLDLPAVDWQSPATPKVFRALELWSENLASGAQWANFYYSVDGGARTLLGTVAISPKDTLYFPSAAFVTGQSIALSLESFTASFGVTPVYRAIVLRGRLRPRTVDEISAVVRIADGIADRQGTPLRSGVRMLQELRDLAGQLAPVELMDLAGATSLVTVQQPVEEVELYQQGEDNPEIAATVRLAVLTFTGG